MNRSNMMLCPSCAVPLTMSERQTVEIDYCPQCRGVWLDRGELDKIIERASGEMTVAARSVPVSPASVHREPPWPRDSRHGYPKRRKSFLEELFD